MTTIETRRYAMLVRVREFGEVHRDRFPASTVGGQAFAAVADAVTALSGHAIPKMSTAREAKDARGAAREALTARLGEINRAARVMAEESPGFDQPFHLRKKRLADEALVTAGRLFAQHAEADKRQFVALGMSESFVVDLTGLVDAFERALLGREAGRDEQTAAQAGIAEALASGLAAVRKLDVIVGIQFAGDPKVMAVWERDRRVENPPRRRRAAPSASAPAPVAVAAPVTTGSGTPPSPAVTPVPEDGDQPGGSDRKLPIAS